MENVSFPPLENGLDYMESAVELLADTPDQRDLKYAVLHIAAAIEVLLKMRLEQEHWSLIFSKIDLATRERHTAGDFHSVTVDDAITRLQNVAGVSFLESELAVIKAIGQKRNRLQHLGLIDSSSAVRASTGEALNFLLSFIDRQFRGVVGRQTDPVEAVLDRIRGHLAGIRELVEARLKELAPLLAEQDVVLECPLCLQPTLTLGEECRCLFCVYESSPAEMAEQYVTTILRITQYEVVKDGGIWPIHDCPSCDQMAVLVSQVVDPLDHVEVSWHDRAPHYWVCFAEGCGWL